MNSKNDKQTTSPNVTKENGSKAKIAKRSQFGNVWHRFKKNKLAMLGLFLLGCLVLVAVFAGVFLDYQKDAIYQNMADRLTAPNSEYPFGTDQYGRNLLGRVVFGTRLSLGLSIATMLTSLLGGLILGSVAGYFGGRVDNVLMRITDIFLAIPAILMALCVVAALGIGLVNLVIAMTISFIPVFARVVRSAVMPLRDQEFIEAARSCGTSNFRIIVRHILPNAIGPIIVQATLYVGTIILTIASLSFIGLGVPSPMPEWGSIMTEVRDQMQMYPYLLIIPGLAIVITVLAVNLIGDGLRDALDPRLKN